MLAPLVWSGCTVSHVAVGPTQYDAPAIDRDDVREVQADLTIGTGDLKVGGGTSKLVQAYFTYNVPAWKPEMHYKKAGGIGSLSITQPGGHNNRFGTQKYEWDLRFPQDLPLSLAINLGAGSAHLDLGSLALRDVKVDLGVGKVDLDLRGNPKHDYSVHLNGGVGEATVHLPGNVGVYAEASGGLGEISAHGLRKEGGHWINDAWNRSPVKIRVNVQGGIGSIKLLGE